MINKEFGVRVENVIYQKRPGVYGICFENIDSLLSVAVIKTPRGYFLPGGGIEENEDHDMCLKREFIEETGMSIELIEYVGQSSQVGLSPRKKRYLHLQGNFYLIQMKQKVGGQVEDDHQLVWIPLKKVKELMQLEYQSYAIAEGFKVLRKMIDM